MPRATARTEGDSRGRVGAWARARVARGAWAEVARDGPLSLAKVGRGKPLSLALRDPRILGRNFVNGAEAQDQLSKRHAK